MNQVQQFKKGLSEDEDANEYYDSANEIMRKTKVVAEFIKNAGENGTVFYTGAGVSTSAEIPDYR